MNFIVYLVIVALAWFVLDKVLLQQYANATMRLIINLIITVFVLIFISNKFGWTNIRLPK